MNELMQVTDERFVVFCENVSSHRNFPNVLVNGLVNYLPKYRPFLNACEMTGSAVKAFVKRQMTEPQVQQKL